LEQIIFNKTIKSSKEMENYYLSNGSVVKSDIVAIIFNVGNDNLSYNYTIRMPYKSVPNDQNLKGSIG
jgi:hypothetical protein